MIGRHFIEAGPGAARIHFERFEAGDAVHGVREDFFDEGRIEGGLKAGAFGGVVPGHEQAEIFRTEVEAGGHIDDHGEAIGQSGERLGGY